VAFALPEDTSGNPGPVHDPLERHAEPAFARTRLIIKLSEYR